MIQSRRAAARAVDAACDLLGRRRVVRAARFALNRARLDLTNSPANNGEHALQRWVLDAIPVSEPVTVFDVGANAGEWSMAMLGHAERTGRAHLVRVHAFEPAADTHRILAGNVPEQVRTNRLALSDGIGEATLHVVAPGAGTNSLHPGAAVGGRGRDVDPVPTELVGTTTVDAYARENGIRHIDLLKIDTEGHDFSVLAGAETLLRAGAISVIQFEYNHRWVHARRFLKDAFELLQPSGYRLGKLSARGVEMYPAWDPELETFIEGNYLACTVETGRRLPQIRWWKADA